MKKPLSTFLVFLSFATFAQQSPDWEYFYGGDLEERVNDVIQTTTGEFVMAGTTASYGAGGTDVYIVRTDNSGGSVIEWTFGGPLNDGSSSIQETADGGFIIAGTTSSYATGNNDRDIWLIRLNSTGESLWANTFGEGSGSSVLVVPDGYVVAGTRFFKTDLAGNLIWNYEFNCVDVKATPDGGFITLARENFDNIILSKRSGDGSEEWTRTFEGGWIDFPQVVYPAPDGGYIIGGTISMASGQYLDGMLLKTDGDGTLLWMETYGGPLYDEFYDLSITSDGGYIVVGITQENNDGDNDVWVVKTDADGTIQWDWTRNSTENNWAKAILQTTNNEYVVASEDLNTGDGYYDLKMYHFNADELTAWFTAAPKVVDIGETVHFYNASLGSPITYSWTFYLQDGSEDYSFDPNPTYSYSAPGSDGVSLTVTNGGESSTFTRDNYIVVNPSGMVPFCLSSGDPSTDWIASVAFDGVTNTSGQSQNGYEDFTDITFSAISGESCSVVLEPGQAPGKKVPKWWRIWIDYDLNGLDEDDLVFSADNVKSTVTGSFTVPPDVVVETQLRISMSTQGVPPYCGDVSGGEVEDYSFTVNPSVPQAPEVDFTADATYVLAGATVNFTDLSINGPDGWNWVFDTGLEEPVNSTLQNPAVEYDIPGVYNVTLSAWNEIGTGTLTKVGYIIVSNTPPPIQYCEPENIQNSILTNINWITIDGITQETAMGPSGYMYYSDRDAFVFSPGQTCSLELSPRDSRARNFWRIWVDADGSGTFDDDELLFVANNKKGNVSGYMTIPSDASAESLVRMRISMKRDAAQTGDACEGGFDGEVEDYNVEFDLGTKSAGAGSVVENQALSLYPNPVLGDALTIRLEGNDQAASIQVYNSHGKVVDSFTCSQPETSLNTSEYAAGVYIVKASLDGKQLIRRFVKLIPK